MQDKLQETQKLGAYYLTNLVSVGISWYWLVSVGIGWYQLVSVGISCYWLLLFGIGWYQLVSVGFGWYRLVSTIDLVLSQKQYLVSS